MRALRNAKMSKLQSTKLQPQPLVAEELIIARDTILDNAASNREEWQVIPGHKKPPVLQVENLQIELTKGIDIVRDISFELEEGEIIGLVGESGSGKSTIGAALLGHARAGARITQGKIRIGDIENLLDLDDKALRNIRGTLVSHVPQDPATSLNPLRRIGSHLQELLLEHHPEWNASLREERIVEVFNDVGLPTSREFLRRFPHQLSGGQQQRVQLALAFILRPKVIVMDEPTTALDVTTQSLVLKTVKTLCQSYGVSAVYVSHDLGVVQELADKVIVLYSGRVQEFASLDNIFANPKHPYTQGLIAAAPSVDQRRELSAIPGQAPAPTHRPHSCAFAPRCPLRSDACQHQPELETLGKQHKVACWNIHQGPAFAATQSNKTTTATDNNETLLGVDSLNVFYGLTQVVFDASFQVNKGECVALVGESGSGKTTISRTIAGVGDQVNGVISYGDNPLPFAARLRDENARRQIQFIFQNPYRSLNPRHTIATLLTTPLKHFFNLSHSQALLRATQVLERVSLPAELLNAYPRELSGGERQRVAIARALACEPSLLICDEITSALDVSVQANILNLLRDLQQSGLSLLFVTHDLGVVRNIANRVVVLYQGRIVEQGKVDDVLGNPQHAYTQQLIAHSPTSTLSALY
jgi:peptide/nickel transport system ATP-binding protein